MVHIRIRPDLKSLCPQLRLGCMEANVSASDSPAELIAQINDQIELIRQSLLLEGISKIPEIEASRKAYKACGKDPARYRLSAEALLRRVVSGKGLYQINNVVDQLNLVSISTGFSIGGYDADRIQGDVVFGIGRADEPYSGIGKGDLNIEGLPVFRDEIGAFGTPTSDSQRTEVSRQTTRFLMVLIDFGGAAGLGEAIDLSQGFLRKYCMADNLKINEVE